MQYKHSLGWVRGWIPGLILLGLMLAGCGSGSTTTTGGPTPTHERPPVASPTQAATATPSIARVPYPWPMDQKSDPITGATSWKPAQSVLPALTAEMEADFLVYWAWSGQDGQEHFPFSPDPTQISTLATASYAGDLQSYVQQVQQTQQVTAYQNATNLINGKPPFSVQSCTQDGLQCQDGVILAGTTKTIYDTKTGAITEQTANVNVIIMVTLVYNQGMQRWQLNALQLQTSA